MLNWEEILKAIEQIKDVDWGQVAEDMGKAEIEEKGRTGHPFGQQTEKHIRNIQMARREQMAEEMGKDTRPWHEKWISPWEEEAPGWANPLFMGSTALLAATVPFLGVGGSIASKVGGGAGKLFNVVGKGTPTGALNVARTGWQAAPTATKSGVLTNIGNIASRVAVGGNKREITAKVIASLGALGYGVGEILYGGGNPPTWEEALAKVIEDFGEGSPEHLELATQLYNEDPEEFERIYGTTEGEGGGEGGGEGATRTGQYTAEEIANMSIEEFVRNVLGMTDIVSEDTVYTVAAQIAADRGTYIDLKWQWEDRLREQAGETPRTIPTAGESEMYDWGRMQGFSEDDLINMTPTDLYSLWQNDLERIRQEDLEARQNPAAPMPGFAGYGTNWGWNPELGTQGAWELRPMGAEDLLNEYLVGSPAWAEQPENWWDVAMLNKQLEESGQNIPSQYTRQVPSHVAEYFQGVQPTDWARSLTGGQEFQMSATPSWQNIQSWTQPQQQQMQAFFENAQTPLNWEELLQRSYAMKPSERRQGLTYR